MFQNILEYIFIMNYNQLIYTQINYKIYIFSNKFHFILFAIYSK
jgi:hypothetical protein